MEQLNLFHCQKNIFPGTTENTMNFQLYLFGRPKQLEPRSKNYSSDQQAIIFDNLSRGCGTNPNTLICLIGLSAFSVVNQNTTLNTYCQNKQYVQEYLNFVVFFSFKDYNLVLRQTRLYRNTIMSVRQNYSVHAVTTLPFSTAVAALTVL